MNDEIPYESHAEAADGHLTAAENYLAIAEGQRETLESLDDIDPISRLQWVNARITSAVMLADLHRKMAETYYPAQRVEIPQSRDVLDEMRERLEAKMAEGAQTPPCDCCVSGLFSVDGEAPSLCADCRHAGDRHNGNAPKADPLDGLNGPGESALLEAARRAESAGWRQVADWLAACAGCNREGKYWPPLIAAPASVGPAKPWRSSGGAGQWRG